MKNIKLLYRFIFFINILFSILLIISIAILVIPDFVYLKNHDDKVFGMFNHLIIFIRGIVLFIGLLQIQKALKAIIKQGFYNLVSEVKFRKSGFFLVIYGIASSIFNICIMSELKLDEFINNFILYFFVVLVGIGLYVLSDFIKSGGILKQENDLTI